jgi:hypothetical protein
MSINLNYKYMAECGEEDMLEKFHHIRTRLEGLPLRQVYPVTKVDPVYQSLMIQRARSKKLVIPPAVDERLQLVDDAPTSLEGRLRLFMSFTYSGGFPKSTIKRFLKPVIAFARETDIWNLSDYPEEIKLDPYWTVNNLALAVEFANVFLFYGYGLLVDIADGSEPLMITLSAYRNAEPPLWLGWGCAKTQYAKDFKQSHALACTVLDIVKDEGLLLSAQDDCEYYEHRDWKRSMKKVNAERDFAWLGSKIIGAEVKRFEQEHGVEVKTIQDNAGALRPPWKADTSDEDDASGDE